MNPYKNQDLRKFLESIPAEEIAERNQEQLKINEAMYEEFIDGMKQGLCFLCKRQLDNFIPKQFCLHWFLRPPGIKKKHFTPHLNGDLSYFRLDAYLRWLANSENPIANINDLKDEVSRSSYIETTIRYKNLEWAISIGHTDKAGHQGASMGERPHYHLQMKVDGAIFLRFNDFHIQFTDEDLFTLELQEQAGDMFEARAYRGDGIGILENKELLKYIDENSVVADDEKRAPFSRQTFITAPTGQMISGDLLADAAEESKRTKEPIGRIMKRMLPNAEITTWIAPGEGVPEMTKRSGKK